jgi:Putative beta-barrel porin-2, OmpL-like. bbp2
MKALWLFPVLLTLTAASAQQHLFRDSAFTIGGYAEIYYIGDFGNPANHTRPSFVYSHNRANEVNLNLGLLQAAYNNGKVRGGLALMAGTYTQANMVNEPDMLKPVYEAWAGVKISRKENLWVDAGVFGSHLGFESPAGIDNSTLTRSMLADNSPYYEAGAKINYTSANERWFISVLILNGWQRIQKVDGNTLPSFGHQITYSAGTKFKINSSSFIGSEDPDSTRRMRYYHDLYAIWKPSAKWELTGGFDCGFQQKQKGSTAYNAWYLPVLIVRYLPNEKWAMALRTEYFSDKGEVIATSTANGFRNGGYSLNADRWFTKNVCWRMEARLFSSPDEMFTNDGLPTRTNFSLGMALALRF